MRAALLCLLALAALTARPATITVLAEELAPLHFRKGGQLRGVSLDIARAVLARAGLAARVELTPFARALARTRSEANVLLCSIHRNPQREADFYWIGPLFRHHDALFRLRSRTDIRVSNLADAAVYRIGLVRGHHAHSLLNAAGFQDERQLQPLHSQEANLRKLLYGRIDLVAATEPDLGWLLRQLPGGAGDAELVEVLALEDPGTELYLALSRQTDAAVAARLQQALQALRKEGRLRQILADYDYRAGGAAPP